MSELIFGKFLLGSHSAVGDPRRKYEDRVYSGQINRRDGSSLVVGIVADGVGSADFGGRGAQLAIDVVAEELAKSAGEDIPAIIVHAVEMANQRLFHWNAEQSGDGLTTLVVGVIHNERFYVGNVGDSRAYWVQGSGKLLQLTRDHTYYNVYGGNPNDDSAGVVVNAIGRKETVDVDLGFYLRGDDADSAYRLGYAGLPLKKGESILLCSDGLIKSSEKGERFAKDEEIIGAIQTEHEQNRAAIKMVGYAEGRLVDDNASAVTIQYLTPEIVAQMQARSTQAIRRKKLGRWGVGFLGMAFMALLAVVGWIIIVIPPESTPAVVYITNTSAPTIAPTQPIDPGRARVDEVNGGVGASVTVGEYLDSGDEVSTGSAGVRIVIGERTGTPSVLYLFHQSTSRIVFGESLAPELIAGALYIRPGNGRGEIHLPNWGGIYATVEGSRMIVEISGSKLWLYCFEGTCRLELPEFATPRITEGQKMLFHLDTGQAEAIETMNYDEQWEWNLECNYCMRDFLPEPTPAPFVPPPAGGAPGPAPTTPAPTPPPATEPPVTEPPVTEPPVTDPPVTDPPVTDPPVTEEPVTEAPHVPPGHQP